jgi:glutathione S-transferase
MGRCTCGCCGCGPSFRRFFSSKEEKEWLENYRDQLKKELAGLEERLKERKEK